MKNLSVYIHIPFCEKKCAYCGFVSFACKAKSVDRYIDALCAEIEDFDSNGYVVDSIFIGGGTPTFLTDSQFERIVDCLKSHFVLDLKEFTIEGNPNSYTQSKINLYKKLGVTRLSVGVQSLNDKVLSGIGRIHNAKQALQCLEMLQSSGLDINCDMMVGLPYQTLDIVKEDMQKIVDFGVNSVSCYSLILEEETPLFESVQKGNMSVPSDDEAVDMYDVAVEILQKAGLERYEISNFGKKCLHNIGYWTLKEYIGFGLSAHSFIGNTRFYNTSDFEEYLQKSARQVEEVLSLEDMQKEYVMLALRMESGVDTVCFIQKFGKSALDNLLVIIEKDKKYYNITSTNIAIKSEYIYLSNSLIANLI